MQPTCVKILRSCVLNLEQIILPCLEDPLAKSTGSCIKMLLNHVALRLEKEGDSLFVDNQEKRNLLNSLADDFQNAQRQVKGKLTSLSEALRERVQNIPSAPRFVPLEELTAENDALKWLLNSAITTITQHKNEFDQARYEKLKKLIYKQLRSQIDREAAMIEPAIDGPFQ